MVTRQYYFSEQDENVGYLSTEDAISFGCTGPTGRGSGVSCDIRKLYPYEVYDKVEFDEILETGGDSFARYMVRIREMQQSIRIIEQLIDNIPEGDFQAKTKGCIEITQRRILFKSRNGPW
jgi:NADH-quinone oxidoreductase subunit D/NADH-quinone oxidoreductase subunit C/D